jgi:2-alkyl-3-oxoalkanoate reductase
MSVLVTGAAGFLGSHVTKLLVEQGEKPRVLIRRGESSNFWRWCDVDARLGDITDDSSLDSAMAGIDRVIHCAARTGPWGPEDEYRSTNVDALESIVRAARSAHVRRVVHVSSITVHGDNVRGTADETTPRRNASNPYSRSKVAAEIVLEAASRDVSPPVVTTVRPGLIYGPGDTASFARFAELIDSGKMVLIGQGRNQMPLIYVTDAARGILLASTADRAAGRVYLLVNDERVTQRTYLDTIASELSRPPVRRRVPYGLALSVATAAEGAAHALRRTTPPPLTRFGVRVLGGDNQFVIGRARSELGFQPHVTLAEGVAESVAWYRRQSGAYSVLEHPVARERSVLPARRGTP